LAAEFNCEMVYYDIMSYDAEEMQGALENLAQQGCDGIIDSLGASVSTMQMLQEKGIYYVGLLSYTEELFDVCIGNQYFAGFGMDHVGDYSVNYDLGHAVMDELSKQGLSNVAYMGAPPGWDSGDELVRGFDEGIKDNGLNLVTSYLGYDTATGASDIVASFGSELDAIASNGENDPLVAAVINSGYDIKLAINGSCTDQAALMESGKIAVVGTGNFAMAAFAFIQLYNAMTGGDKLFEDVGTFTVPKMIIMTSADELRAYEYCCQGAIPGYSFEELKLLTSKFNPEASVAEKEALFKQYCSVDYYNIRSLAERFGYTIGG